MPLLFCKHPKPTLIHNILADAVEVTSGSRQLLQILNRLGHTSSPDTLMKYHMSLKVSMALPSHCWWSKYVWNTYMNILVLQSFHSFNSFELSKKFASVGVVGLWRVVLPVVWLWVVLCDGWPSDLLLSNALKHILVVRSLAQTVRIRFGLTFPSLCGEWK